MPAANPLTMNEFVEAFVLYLREERGLQRTTIERYERGAADFVNYLADKQPQLDSMRLVEKGHVLAFLRSITSPRKQPATWNITLAAVRAFFEFLLDVGAAELNPTKKIERAKNLPKDVVTVSFDEYVRLLDAVEQAPGHFYRVRNRLVVLILFFGAIRVSELVGLDLDQVDLEGRLFVDVRRKRGRRLSSPFNDLIAEALEAYLVARAGLELPDEEQALLVSDRRRRISVRTVQEMVKRYAEVAGIRRSVYPHLLRHSSASHLAAVNTPQSVIQELLGHQSVETTRRYIHVAHGQRQQAVERLSKAFQEHVADQERVVGD